jgi:hypothetical protein
MKTSSEWSQIWFDYKTKGQLCRAIQADALRHAAKLIHDMSRGTKSEERAIAIDEARDIIMDEIKSMAEMPNIRS